MTLAANFRVPFFSVEFDATRASAGPALLPYKVLLMGQRTSAGTVAELVVKRVTSEAQARTWFGEGSQLHLMVRAFLANATFVELHCIAIDDHASGVAATKTLTVTASSAAAGTMYLYIGGKRIPITVTANQAQNSIATAIDAAIDAVADLPMVSGSPSTNVVTLAAMNDGAPGNDIDVRFNYGEGEAFPSGVSVAVATGATGSADPDVQEILDVIGDEWYNIMVGPWGDTTNLGILETELADRFGGIRMIPSQYIFAKDANFASMQTFGDARNSPHVRCLDFYGIPWTPFEYAAAWAALEAGSAQADPAKPLFRQTINGLGAKPPAIADRRTLEEQNSLLFDGISIFGLTSGGGIQILRAITMYQENDAGAADDSYLRAETMYTLAYLRYSFTNWFLTRYPRAKLADDGVTIPAGQSVITPSIAKAEAIAWARSMENDLGLVENIDQFKNDLIVTRNAQDRDRLDFVLSPDTINQFVVGAATMKFIL